jgi:hypothetical protein
MKQFSNDGSPVIIEVLSGDLLFIDPLYFTDIAKHTDDINLSLKIDPVIFIKRIEQKVFHYGGGLLIGYKKVRNPTYEFNIGKMQKFDFTDAKLVNDSVDKTVTAFATDTGTFLIIDFANIDKLIECISYDELIDNALTKNDLYFQKITSQLQNRGWAFIETPGINSNYVFKGSGSFIVKE